MYYKKAAEPLFMKLSRSPSLKHHAAHDYGSFIEACKLLRTV